MVFKELQDDLFNLNLRDSDTYFVQCISADLRMGRGIAEQFNEHFNVKQILMAQEPGYLTKFDNRIQYVNDEKIDDAGIIKAEGTPVYNLVTKRNYWEKPTYLSMYHALMLLRLAAYEEDGVMKLLMPRIGCGLDKLNWTKVKGLIMKVFEDTDVQITVCRLREVT